MSHLRTPRNPLRRTAHDRYSSSLPRSFAFTLFNRSCTLFSGSCTLISHRSSAAAAARGSHSTPALLRFPLRHSPLLPQLFTGGTVPYHHSAYSATGTSFGSSRKSGLAVLHAVVTAAAAAVRVVQPRQTALCDGGMRVRFENQSSPSQTK